MEYLVTAEEMKAYDRNTIEGIGIPASVLMERAALAVEQRIVKLALAAVGMRDFGKADEDIFDKIKNTKVLIVAGSGNNGGDGLALARLLTCRGMQVTVLECGDMKRASREYQLQKMILEFYHVRYIRDLEEFGTAGIGSAEFGTAGIGSAEVDGFAEYDFIVDSLFGVGLSRPIEGSYAEVIGKLNAMGGIKVAIDIPSGIDASTGAVLGCAFKADETITFGFGKRGLCLYPGAEYAGKVFVADMGIDENSFFGRRPEMFTYNEEGKRLLPPRDKAGNKGTFGKALVMAGWENMTGAGILCAKALMQTGAGMVKVYSGETGRFVLPLLLPEAMYGDRTSLMKDLEWADVYVAGPGLGRSEEACEVLKMLLEVSDRSSKPVLLDADALNLIAEREELQQQLQLRWDRNPGTPRLIMTPHLGELSRLCGLGISHIKANIVETAQSVSRKYGCVVVCKDARTLVCAPGQPIYLNTTGNSGMATAGSGDVLSGMIGALLCQGQEPFQAACTGVYLHGLAGDEAARKVTEYGVTASQIIEKVKEFI